MIRRRVKVYEAPSPEERRRLEAHRLDAVEQHRVRAHVDRGWPTATEFVCPTCEVSSSRAWCWRCGADLSDLPEPHGQSAPVSPSPGAPLDGSAAAGRGTSSGRLARVAGEGPPGSDPTSNGGV